MRPRPIVRSLAVCLLVTAATARATTTITVTSTLSAGPNTLRQAIIDANADLSPDPVRIIFSIDSGAVSIAPTTALPAITRPVIIDGTTQLGFTGTPLIELRGDSAPAGSSGLVLTGHSGSTVRGLVINRFTSNISGLGGFAVEIDDDSGDHVIAGNYLGTDATGAAAAANSRGGLLVHGSNVTIGGTTAADRNVISGNGTFGLLFIGGTDSTVMGNYVGLNAAGTAALLNGTYGFDVVETTDLAIGGTDAGAGNVIAGSNAAVVVDPGTAGTMVIGNLIGTNAAGTAVVGNGSTGVRLDGVDGATVDDNVIGGFSDAAIILQGGSNVTIKGNHVGVDASGTVPLALGGIGIAVEGISPGPTDVTIGGTGVGDGNVVTNCGTIGVGLLGEPMRITIRGNRITGNGELGIDLDNDGVSPNDPDDDDGGSNGGQNFPVLTTARASASNVMIDGTLTSLPNASYAIDFYASAAADASGFGEGATYLGSAIVLIGGTGTAPFGITLPVVVTPGDVITATATDGAGNTSEFSAALTSTAASTSTTTTSTTTTSSTIAGSSSTSTTTTITTVTTSTTTTTLLCDLPGVARVVCLLAALPSASCTGERLPKPVTAGLGAARTQLGKTRTASVKAARRLEKVASARLEKAAAKLAKTAMKNKVGATCAHDLGASIREARTLIAQLLVQ
jgi:hypothetical protein